MCLASARIARTPGDTGDSLQPVTMKLSSRRQGEGFGFRGAPVVTRVKECRHYVRIYPLQPETVKVLTILFTVSYIMKQDGTYRRVSARCSVTVVPGSYLPGRSAKGCTKYSRGLIVNLESMRMKKPPCESGGMVVVLMKEVSSWVALY